jgi:serine phosphatase RsbU (regulator of sigma subunit)
MINILDPNLIYRTLVGSVVKEMFLENGLLLLPDPAKQGYHVELVEGVEGENLSTKQLGNGEVLLQVLQEKNDAIFLHEVDLNPYYEPQREALQHTFRSFSSELMLPMKYKDEMRGIISLGRKKSGKMFTQEDLDLLKTVTNQSAVALENATLFRENLEKGRLEEELKIAHDIQVSMLPDKAPQVEGVQIAACSIPAREVGGDFYDFIDMRRNGAGDRLGIVVGDVSGKAVSGALVMAASRSIFRVLAEAHSSVEEVMRIGNQRLNKDIKKGMFVALLYVVVDPQQKTLTLSNAGQTQPIICPGDKSEPLYIDTAGDSFPLGIVKNCRYQETQVPLKQGDTVVLYTDGVVEAMNDKGELYGFERFMTSIEGGRELDATTLLEKLMDDVSRYVGGAEQHDDLTIVVVKVE